MRKRNRKTRAGALLISLALLFSMIPASAYASDVPVVLDMAATSVDVIVSEKVILNGQTDTVDLEVSPINVTNNGKVGTIVVSEIAVDTQNGWSLASENAGFEKMAANIKSFYLGYKEHDFTDGSFEGTVTELGPGKTSTIQLSAKAGAQTEAISDITIANVVLTVKMKGADIRWGQMYQTVVGNNGLRGGFIFYEDGSMMFGKLIDWVISSLPAGSLTYKENGDGTITATSSTDEGTNTFTFSSGKAAVTVESSYLDTGNDDYNVNDLTFICEDVNIRFGETYYGFMPYINGSFDDYDGTEVFGCLKFYPNGTISANDNSNDLDPFSYVYHYKDTHAFFWNLDNEYLFDETGESCTNLWASYFGVDIPFSIDIPDVVKNGVAWGEKYTGNIAGANYSVEFYIDGADVTAKLYNEGVYASTMEDILLGRMLINGQKILGMVDQTTGNMIMFSADASSCTMTDSAGNVMGTLTLE